MLDLCSIFCGILFFAGVVDEREGGGAEGGEGAHQRFFAKSRVLRPSEAQRKGKPRLKLIMWRRV